MYKFSNVFVKRSISSDLLDSDFESKLFLLSNSFTDFSNSDILELKLFIKIFFSLILEFEFLFFLIKTSYDEYLFFKLDISLFDLLIVLSLKMLFHLFFVVYFVL